MASGQATTTTTKKNNLHNIEKLCFQAKAEKYDCPRKKKRRNDGEKKAAKLKANGFF